MAKTVGIIAEYNPFHNGHLYQLEQAKELSGADYAVIVLSGNFTQRGLPALTDKYVRSRMALQCGADVVIELPVRYATASAESFALGAVSILSGLGVDALCFGSECGDVSALFKLAQFLTKEPDSFKQTLSAALREGLSYPAARQLALGECLSGEMAALLQTPNNILGVEYIKALLSLHSSMEIYTLPRKGKGYGDDALEGSYCSALALRKALAAGTEYSALSGSMPAPALATLSETLSGKKPLSTEDFSSMLYYRLLSLEKEGYTTYGDVTPSLSDKIAGNLECFRGWSDFSSRCLKSRDLTQTRIDRCLLHILLDIQKTDLTSMPAPYARLLGFRESSQAVFGLLKGKSVPLISKLADAGALSLSPAQARMLRQDVFAAHLYEQTFAQKNGGEPTNEYRRSIIIT